MKKIIFRPLRKIKKSGKIIIASYMGWRKVKTADYSKFHLVVDNEYKDFADEDFVYNSKGELLYFFNYNPAEIPVFNILGNTDIDNKLDAMHEIFDNYRNHIIIHDAEWGQHQRAWFGLRWCAYL